mmetsp:Transcript_38403/g.74484  ORF Transcript_38403/g.74484 Transcript_38403/m.74484 type:complete len:211 (-) Transcript_38403:570-1202(-)
MNIPSTRNGNPMACMYWNFSHPIMRENIQMTRVRTLSKTIRVVAEIVLVTVTPKKLKKPMLTMFPRMAAMTTYELPICTNASSAFSSLPPVAVPGIQYMGTRRVDSTKKPQNPSHPTACSGSIPSYLVKNFSSTTICVACTSCAMMMTIIPPRGLGAPSPPEGANTLDTPTKAKPAMTTTMPIHWCLPSFLPRKIIEKIPVNIITDPRNI